MNRFSNILLIMSFVMGVLVSAPTAHSHVVDQDTGVSETEIFQIDDQFGHNHDNESDGSDHNCCSHHCHHSHAMLSNALASFVSPDRDQKQLLVDMMLTMSTSYGIKRPPRFAA